MSMNNPPHPGDFIRTEIIEPAGLSVTAAALALQVSRPALSSLLNGKADLSGEMALRIEKAFGVKMDTLTKMQASKCERGEQRIDVVELRTFCRAFGVNLKLFVAALEKAMRMPNEPPATLPALASGEPLQPPSWPIRYFKVASASESCFTLLTLK